jgi:hypothetical protein
MATKTKTYRSDSKAVVTVAGDGLNTIDFGEVDTYSTDDPAKQAALEQNPDVDEVKGTKKK